VKAEPPPKTLGARAVVGGLLVTGAVLAAVILWTAPVPARPGVPPVADDVSAAGSPAENGPPRQAAATVAAPADARSFFEPSATGAVAYSSGDYEGALAQYRSAIERNPDDAESHSNLGQMLVRLSRPAEALPYFDRAIALLPARWAYHFNRARAFALLERWDDAIGGYRQAQQLFPDDYATAFNLGQALHRKGDEAAAVDAYRRAIELDPSDATFHFALANSYERLEQRPAAAAAYTEYLRLSPEAADADRVRARIALLTDAS
jgi:protein O-GlcNAc transferase